MLLTVDLKLCKALTGSFVSNKRSFFVCLKTPKFMEQHSLEKLKENMELLEIKAQDYDCPSRLMTDISTYASIDKSIFLNLTNIDKQFLEQLFKLTQRAQEFFIVCFEHQLDSHALQIRLSEHPLVETWVLKLEQQERQQALESNRQPTLSNLIAPYLQAQKKKLDDKEILIALRENPQIFEEAMFEFGKRSVANQGSIQALIKYLDKALGVLSQPEPSYLNARFFKWLTKDLGIVL